MGKNDPLPSEHASINSTTPGDILKDLTGTDASSGDVLDALKKQVHKLKEIETDKESFGYKKVLIECTVSLDDNDGADDKLFYHFDGYDSSDFNLDLRGVRSSSPACDLRKDILSSDASDVKALLLVRMGQDFSSGGFEVNVLNKPVFLLLDYFIEPNRQ